MKKSKIQIQTAVNFIVRIGSLGAGYLGYRSKK